ncbi:unnamed protein product [Clavelina lepadiformis]|uniref:Insulin receptor substrate 1 n=1 Tax=Clavelina lepadiformis TaxID=159417 RepID=A0ABP0H2J3_CLALP
MPPEQDNTSMTTDIVLKGSLRKAKSWNKRYFVLREGSPAKLEYYENEKRWRANKLKRSINLEKPWNVDTKKDSKHDYLIVIFTEDEYFSMAADCVETQMQWVQALQRVVRPEPGSLLFKHVWHVTLDNKELDMSKSNLMINLQGPHRICLTHDQMVFVHANSNGGGDRSKGDPIEIRITTIRVCGHKETSFFIEPGRGSGIGNGKLWMDLNDEVMAQQMHSTILELMYALKQEEDSNGYRGRSYSSGSNCGRMRSVRSQNKNPPPSLIGMGKIPNILSSSKRVRCDSLPAPHVVGLNDSRLRAGSEGEHTMKRPSRFSGLHDTNGSISPGMRRFHHSSKRGTYICNHHHPNITHTHTVSLPGSCNNSSAASSTEHLNAGFISNSEFLSAYSNGGAPLTPLTQSPVVGEHQTEDFVGGHSPTQGYMQLSTQQRLRCQKTYQNNGRSMTPEFPTQSNPTIHEDSAAHNYCHNCLSHIPSCAYNEYYYQQRVQVLPFEPAPPPPNVQPPPLGPTTTSASFNHEYTNVPAHSRAPSLDDNLSCGTATSSLSVSPQQMVNFAQNADASEYVPMSSHVDTRTSIDALGIESQCSSQEDDGSLSDTPTSSSPKSSQPVESFPSTLNEYATMNSDNSFTYPHQKMSNTNHRSHTSQSFLSKIYSTLASGGSLSPSSNSPGHGRGTPPSADYTPMNPPTPISSQISENQSRLVNSSHQQTEVCNGYVQMRSFINQSLPKEIENRRRSVPDAAMRANNSNLTPPYGYSPDKPFELMNPVQQFCPTCVNQITLGKAMGDDSEYCKMQSMSPRYNCQLKLPCDTCDVPGRNRLVTTASINYLSPPTSETTSRISTPSPSTKSSDEYLNMKPLQQEVADISFNRNRSRTGTGDSGRSNASSSPSESGMFSKDADIADGCLPVSGRTFHSIRSVAENKNNRLTSQKKERNGPSRYSTNSLDRPKKAQLRPKSLGLRHTREGGNARRTQSLRHGKKSTPPSLDIFRGAHRSSPPIGKPTSRPPLSPGGEYVNIDYTKAQEQAAQSPYVIKSHSKSSSPRLRHVKHSSPDLITTGSTSPEKPAST